MSFERLPDNMQEPARAYYEYGRRPGDFLYAVLENDLVEAFRKADHENIEAMRDWATWLYSDIPRLAWGDRARVETWILKGGRQGIDGLIKEKENEVALENQGDRERHPMTQTGADWIEKRHDGRDKQ